MTKKETAELEALRKELREAKAFRLTDRIEPDVMPPATGGASEIVNGWLYNAYQGVRVEKSCTSSVYHSFGDWDKTTTQGSRRLYSTKLLALKAGRAELERKYAAILAIVDLEIEREAQG